MPRGENAKEATSNDSQAAVSTEIQEVMDLLQQQVNSANVVKDFHKNWRKVMGFDIRESITWPSIASMILIMKDKGMLR